MHALFIYMNVVFQDSKPPVIGWVDAPMCPRPVEINHSLLRRIYAFEAVVNLFEEQ